MDGFQLYRRPAGSLASTPRNGTSVGPEKYVSSGAPNGGGLQVLLGPLPSRQAHAASRPSGYGGKGLDEGYDPNGVVISDLHPHYKRKAENSDGSPAAIKTAVKNAVATATSSPAAPTPQKKRGRPKGWKPGMAYSETTNHPRSEAARLLYVQRKMRENPNFRPRRPAKPPERPPGRLPGPDRPASKPVGKPVSRPAGRPLGSGSGAMKGPPKPRGRPPKKPPLTPRGIYLSLKPRFEPYPCEWSGCQAELHNMATLRAHVHKVHGGNTGCRWGSCAENPVTGAPTAASFPSGDRLAHHVEKEHMIPLQWLRGDGFKAGPISSAKTTTTASYDDENGEAPAIPSYLLDKDGNQLTPWVWYQKLEDNATRLANKKRLQQTLFQMNEDAPSEEEDEDCAGEVG